MSGAGLKHKIFVFLLSFTCLLGAVSAHAKSPKTKSLLRKEVSIAKYTDKDWRLSFKLKQRAEIWDSKLENSFRYNVYVEPNYKLKISELFYISAKVGIGATVGSVQSRFGDLRSTSFITLKDSRFFYRKLWNENTHYLKLSLGAINQSSFLSNSRLYMLISRRALPGLEQIYKYENTYKDKKSFGFDVRFFEGIPTSESLSLDFNEKDDLPSYVNGRAEVFIKDMSDDFGYRAGVHAGFFNFSKLPSVIADESRLYGNSVQGFGAASEFVYSYKGWYAGWNTVLSYKRWEFEPFLNILTNSEAPSGRNQGQNYGARIKYHDHSFYSLQVEPFLYFNESDASIASYNGSRAGHNNREGYGMNLALDLPRRSLNLRLTYIFVDVLESNSNLQIPYHFVGLNMEYKYDL